MSKKEENPFAKIDYHLLSQIAHDIRGPFNGLIGFSELLAQHAGLEKGPEYAQLVNQLANKSYLNLQLFIIWLKLISENYTPNLSVVSMDQVMDHVQAATAADMEHKAIHAEFKMEEVSIKVDQVFFSVAISAIIGQILKYSSHESNLQISNTSHQLSITTNSHNDRITKLFAFFCSEEIQYDSFTYSMWVARQILKSHSQINILPAVLNEDFSTIHIQFA